ncbi:hypothetical protein Fmac_021068 [Flemingia macrophylla]|uniref:Large ribosomal subunit protein uL4 C-terminal domain-containing protein n=1 Tax=Flemingia macrophylla TaxID=520843 RepID=A0ABD1LVU2_9FABA
MLNRQYISRKGPLIVYKTKGAKVVKAFRNGPSIETKSAFEKLDSVCGSFDKPYEKKKGYVLPRLKMMNSDLTRIINSDEHVRDRGATEIARGEREGEGTGERSLDQRKKRKGNRMMNSKQNEGSKDIVSIANYDTP